MMATMLLLLLHAHAALATKGSLKRRIDRAEMGESQAASSTQPSSSTSTPRRSLMRRVDKAETQPPPSDVPLTKTLKQKWASGKMSSKDIQEMAASAEWSGAEGVSAMSTAGASGAHPQNMQRSLLNFFGKPACAPDFTWVRLPTSNGDIAHPVLLPHEFFSSLFHHGKQVWDKDIRGPDGLVSEFWRAIADSEIVANHPGLSLKHIGKTIPIGLHGDAGSFSFQDSLLVLSWNSLTGAMGGSGFCRRLVFTFVRKQDATPAVMAVLWKVFAWSVNALLTGITPEEDWEGRATRGGGEYIAHGWRASLIQVRGDWEFYANMLGFANWANKGRMCWMCSAEKDGPRTWRNFGPAAPWRPTRKSHRSWQEELEREGSSMPLLFALVIGLSLPCLMIDVMHCLDLGVTSHIVANIFVHCIRKHAFGGRTIEENTTLLNEHLKKWSRKARAAASLQGPLTWERLKTKSGFPKLKAKAAATRVLMEYALELAQLHCRDDLRIVAIAQLHCEFYALLASSGLVMSQASIDRIRVIAPEICVLYTQLSRDALDRRTRMWKMTPKWHIFLHLAEWQIPNLKLNPRSFWTYGDENLVGQTIEVAESCHVVTLAPTALAKWLLLEFD